MLLFIDQLNQSLETTVDCQLHIRLAHQATLEWALAMSSLRLPPCVLEHIFNSLKVNSGAKNYQDRIGMDVWIPDNSPNVNANFVRLIMEERSHADNIRLFLAIQNVVE